MSRPLSTLLENGVQALVEELILDENRLDERRSFQRVPFSRPVTLTATKHDATNSSSGRFQWSAMTRNISATGVGLLSRIAVEPGAQLILTIPQRSGSPVILKTEIQWCESFCDGLYVMGGRFLEATESFWDRLDVIA